ncbi:unnamed protein product [Clavelina lepadiformis]|uniref:Claudin n=1 Tax=Clavelina lepadiformis TaxID=159417 RepID=A0ABP0H5G7_CLALP
MLIGFKDIISPVKKRASHSVLLKNLNVTVVVFLACKEGKFFKLVFANFKLCCTVLSGSKMYCQISAFVLGLMATAACVTATFWNQWAVSGPESGGIAGPIWLWRSLWGECMQYQGGQYHCEEQASMLEDDAYLIIIRALMCISIIFSTGACFLTLVGLQCSRLLDDAPNKKRKLMFVSCCLHACAGVFTLGSMAWYTGLVVREYFSWENQDNIFRYEIGAAVYLGYVSSFFSIFAAIACGCMPGPRDETKDYAPRYTPSYKPSANGYVTKDKMEYV